MLPRRHALFAMATAVVLVTAGCGIQVTGPSVLPNGSFESDTLGWAAQNASVVRTRGGVDGRWAATVTALGRGIAGVSTAPNPLNSISVGQEYAATAFIRCTGVLPCPAQVRLILTEYSTTTSGGKPIPVQIVSAPLAPTTTWQPVQVGVTADVSGDSIGLEVVEDAPASRDAFQLDAVVLVPVTDLPPPRPNPGYPLAGPTVGSPTVLYYGDSITVESQQVIAADLPGKNVVFKSFGGTAICDWTPNMAADLRLYKPAYVINEFIGNDFTACLRDGLGNQFPLGSQAYYDHYAADAKQATEIQQAAHAKVIWAENPPVVLSISDFPLRLNAIYAAVVAAHPGASMNKVGEVLTFPGAPTVFTEVSPVQFGETPAVVSLEGAFVITRTPEHVHLTPAGIRRFAQAQTVLS